MKRGDGVRLAVLIDNATATATVATTLLAEIAAYGIAQVRRAYGDFTAPHLAGWRGVLLAHSIQPVQQFAYTSGKNATDAALMIDAMDLLHAGQLDGFCLVSSDSDFTPLAMRLRASGMRVLGERKTPRPFVVACDRFTYFDNLPAPPVTGSPDSRAITTSTATGPAAVPEASAVAGAAAPPDRAAAPRMTGSPTDASRDPSRDPGSDGAAAPHLDQELIALLQAAVDAASGDDGFAALAEVGALIRRRRPDFDPRTYGHTKVRGLMTAVGVFEVKQHVPGPGKGPVVHVRATGHPPATPSDRARLPAPRTALP